MPKDTGGRKKPSKQMREMNPMGALIWFLFIAIVTLVMDWETFFS